MTLIARVEENRGKFDISEVESTEYKCVWFSVTSQGKGRVNDLPWIYWVWNAWGISDLDAE